MGVCSKNAKIKAIQSSDATTLATISVWSSKWRTRSALDRIAILAFLQKSTRPSRSDISCYYSQAPQFAKKRFVDTLMTRSSWVYDPEKHSDRGSWNSVTDNRMLLDITVILIPRNPSVCLSPCLLHAWFSFLLLWQLATELVSSNHALCDQVSGKSGGSLSWQWQFLAVWPTVTWVPTLILPDNTLSPLLLHQVSSINECCCHFAHIRLRSATYTIDHVIGRAHASAR